MNVLKCKYPQDAGLFIIRVGLGLIFMKHGFPKLMGGSESWQWLGSQMSYVGITFAPQFWGFLAAAAEFFGGICLVVGYRTQLASFFLACVMFVATVMHYSIGDQFGVLAQPLSLLVVFIGLMIAGGGMYTLERYIYGR